MASGKMISARLDGMKEARALFNRISQRMQNPNTAMEVIATKGWKDVIDHFQNEEGPGGTWPGLKYTRRRGGNKVLQDTGRLRISNRWRVVGGDEAHVYNNVAYANYHNKGTSRIPQRKFMWISDKSKLSMIKTLLRWIAAGRLK